jgi:ABC-type bacteriocin/lantibiotic exporter with double-glycine peptidase domain
MPVLPIEHILQESEVGCLAACSQMILQFLGIRKSQHQLNRLFRTTSFGVPFSRIVRLEQFRLNVSINTFGDEMVLTKHIDQHISPIIFLRTQPLPYWQANTQHAVVVIGYDDNHFLINDPAFKQAPQHVAFDTLMLAWDGMDYAYALIRSQE